MKIYTRDGDDGSTGLYFGGRVSKNAPQIDLNGAVDEAQACLGVARAWCDKGSRLNDLLVSVERDLWILMAEVATAAENRHKLKDGATRVTAAMVDRLENEIDALSATMPALKEFVVPGESHLSAALDVARTVIRRAERAAVAYGLDGSLVVTYLNRLSDLAWTMARWADGTTQTTARDHS